MIISSKKKAESIVPKYWQEATVRIVVNLFYGAVFRT